MGTYSVTRVSTGSGGSTFRSFRITNDGGAFAIPVATNKLSSICNFPTGDAQATEHISGFVDVRRVHSIYIHSPGFGGHNCVGVAGSRGIMAKIAVNVGYGGLIHWQTSGSEHDFVEVAPHAVSTITLELRDAAGQLLDLKGSSWSCTLIFER